MRVTLTKTLGLVAAVSMLALGAMGVVTPTDGAGQAGHQGPATTNP
ncbi:hypothetical protein [Streptomyces sp. NPDC007264]